MSKQNKRVLIVEDEEDTADMLAEMLKLGGYEVSKILSSVNAVQSIQENPPDAILLDLMMPEVSGMDILGAIRSNASLEHLPVIVISAKAGSEDLRRGFEAGATEYLTKPVTYQILRKSLETHLARRKAA